MPGICIDTLNYRFSKAIKCPEYEESGLCEGIPLLLSKEAILADLGAVRAQEDWLKHIGPLVNHRGGMGPEISFIPAIIPECLPDRLEVMGYANEFGFMHDDHADAGDKQQSSKENSVLLDAFDVRNGASEAYQSGKARIQSSIMLRMLSIDRASALASFKAGAEHVRSATEQQDPAAFQGIQDYLDFRIVDFGQMFWQAVITFGMGLCIPQNEESLCVDLCRPAWVAAALCNDLYSWDRELKRAQDLGQAEVMNALWVLTHQNGSSINDAKAACRTMIKDSVTQFLQVVHETKCRTDVSNDLKVYVEALQYFVSGNLAWSLTCPKYHEEIDFNEQQRDWLVSGAPESTPVHHGGSQHTIPKETPSIQAIGVLNGDAVPKGDSIRVGSVLEGFNGASISNGGGVTDSHLQTNGHAVPSHLPVPLDTAVDYQCASANSHATSSVHALPHRSPIYNGTTDHEQHSKTADKPVHEDVVLCELPKLDKEVIEAPAQYIKSMPSKGVRSKVIDALNLWLKVPPESLRIVKDITDMLHTASLMLDDFQDGSKLRRGKPSAHTIFGPGPTVNSAFFQFVLAVKETDKLNNPECRKVLLEELDNMFVGQSLDLDWTSNLMCPSIEEYLKMVDFKTGGLFRLLAKLMSALSPLAVPPNIGRWATLFGRYFQIRDDYQNLTSAEYEAQKGFADDLDEGKFSLPLIHTLLSLPQQETIVLRNLLTQRRVAGRSPLFEHKTLILELMKRAGSLEFTVRVLRRLMVEIEVDMREMEEHAGENPQLRVMALLLAI